jgi:hypothetical protein
MRNKLTQDRPTLFIDQYGSKYWAASLKELKERAGYAGGAAKQYNDLKDGRTVWTGYVLGARWFTAFNPAQVAA